VNKAYRIEVSWASDDQVWVADVPDLACCSAHGASPHEAVEQVERAVEAWSEAATQSGRRVPPPTVRAARA
jgi:predicted RNase H-like HicB family nuclease